MLHVQFIRTVNDVFRVAADGIVAIVTGDFWPVAVGEVEGNSVRAFSFFAEVNLSVTFCLTTAHPRPAIIVTSRLNTTPKTFAKLRAINANGTHRVLPYGAITENTSLLFEGSCATWAVEFREPFPCIPMKQTRRAELEV
jgi:hypothetical protein